MLKLEFGNRVETGLPRLKNESDRIRLSKGSSSVDLLLFKVESGHDLWWWELPNNDGPPVRVAMKKENSGKVLERLKAFF